MSHGDSIAVAPSLPEAWWRRGALGTWLVVVGLYGGFGLVTLNYHALPWWLVAPLGGYLVCLHGSLQHEAVHGRPTGIRWLDTLIVFPSLWLYLPFDHYRESHLRHHQDQDLTDPRLDPESNYLMPEQWAALSSFGRWLHRTLRTLAGRMILVPIRAVWLTWRTDFPKLLAGDRHMLRLWLPHIPAVAIVLWWVLIVCDIPFWHYVLFFVYPGIALTVLRSFTEHRPAEKVAERTAIVEAGLLTRILFLGNNYHALHHRDPWRPWYDLGAVYERERAAILAGNGGCVFRGYREIARRYLFTVRDGPVHPILAGGQSD
ncbi:MAG: fatty acid desaturase [Alphaproteobacteria bacterium]